jgi:tRNA-splicing ligase RtcB
LYLAGAPAGDKVSNSTRVPFWIKGQGQKLKRAFLSVLFGNELQCPYIRAKNAFTSPQLAFHKIESKKEDLQIFLSQVKNLLSEFGISTSPIAAENCKTIRKDDSVSKKLYFSIYSHGPNILRLFKEIPFKYAAEKQRRFVKVIETFLQNSQYLEKEWALYEKVMQMHDDGLGRRTTFKRLQLPQKYFYKINAWIHYGNKTLYYDGKNLF